MKEFFKNFFVDRKNEISENGFFYCVFVWLLFAIFFILVFPIWFIGIIFISLNEYSKSWFGGVSNV